ncbi:MAG: IS3 family transposase [bacterium]
MGETKARRSRRSFTEDFKASAVRLVLDEGKTVAAAARDLGLTESSLRTWVEQARADRTKGKTGLTTAEREELGRLRKENRELRTEREILKKAGGLLREAPAVRFAWIAAEKALFTIRQLCRALDVAPSGFYAWRRRPESAHAQRDRRLRVLVRTSFDESKHRYGSPRIHEDLREQDLRVSRKRVIRLMQEDGLQARPRKRFKCTTMSDHDQPVAANLLDRQFIAEAPNQRWVGDTSEFLIGESGKLYLAAILDLFSRFVVGWAVSAVNDRHLTIKALEMALKRRCPDVGLLHHSDQGCTYASEDYQRILDAHGITCSMSRRGDCYDNAVMESFFSTVKSELGEHFASCGDAKMELFDYIEVFYNQRRRHSTLGQISPAAFERRAQEAQAA